MVHAEDNDAKLREVGVPQTAAEEPPVHHKLGRGTTVTIPMNQNGETSK